MQETSKNYGLIWKENGRKYPLVNAKYYFPCVVKDVESKGLHIKN